MIMEDINIKCILELLFSSLNENPNKYKSLCLGLNVLRNESKINNYELLEALDFLKSNRPETFIYYPDTPKWEDPKPRLYWWEGPSEMEERLLFLKNLILKFN